MAWTDELVQELSNKVAGVSGEIAYATVEKIAEEMNKSPRQVAGKTNK